ncbi:DUF4383 domain-containing protein [Prescottella agglutinans]|uniref:DUF4383 domain-containing protein n=1 Tax=Prescottella agglutinans TaxID=1644129 RepID=A0A3S3D1N9_9NOCA|nr:DUF4383 domain-containing protein [Prescottella agglutinans]RVW10950.1 DUF4383 domain-containing protein [Prescottella agglutinans]
MDEGLARTTTQLATIAVSVTILVIGVLGFVPGVTFGLGDITWAGPGSDAQLLGWTDVSVLHNAAHITTGILGLVLSRTLASAEMFLIGTGLVAILLGVYGLVIDADTASNFMPIDRTASWLHLVTGVTLVFLGVALPRHDDGPTDATYR